MPDPIRLVAGLGNPGPRYAPTRHNAGFWFADGLVARHGARFRAGSRFAGEIAEIAWRGETVRVLKPDTWMNHSGRAVGALARYFQIEPVSILVVHDEVDLAPGTVRLKRGGGHGGHNGVRDVTAVLGSSDFGRVRIGVGHPGSADAVVDYVLTRAPAAEQSLIDDVIERTLGFDAEILAGDLETAMNVLHTRPAADGAGAAS